MNKNLPKIAIFVSGSGTNMENLLKHIQAGEVEATPALVVCDKPGAAAIDKANKYNVEVAVVDRKLFADKASFEAEILRSLEDHDIDWIILAGFMRILSDAFVLYNWGKIINIHPSLLPLYPGAHGIQDAYEAKAKETGATTHFVVPEVDAGPVILQKSFPIEEGESLESVEQKVHAVEYEIYPATLRLILSGQVQPPPKPE